MHQHEEPSDRPILVGVSPAWQVLAVIGLLVSLFLILLTVGLGAAYFLERDRARRPGPSAATVAFAPPAAAWNQPVDNEPVNPPYPLVADLRPDGVIPLLPGEDKLPKPGPGVRERFLKLGDEVWIAPNGMAAQHVAISPDEQQIAYLVGTQLYVGPLNGPADLVGAAAGGAGAGGPPGAMAGPPGGAPAWAGGGVLPDQGFTVVGPPLWSSNSQQVYFADADGNLFRLNLLNRLTESLGLNGESPVLVGNRSIVFRRTHPAPKVDLPGVEAQPDPSEIVLCDLQTREVQVLIENATGWKPVGVSPDDKQLVLAADAGRDRSGMPLQKLFLRELADKSKSPPRRVLTPAGRNPGPVCWSADGKSLIYAMSPEVSPPDRGDFSGAAIWSDVEVYHLDLATERHTRLTRGGTVSGFSPTSAEQLHIVVWQHNPPRWSQTVRRMPLRGLLDFAAREPERPLRDVEAWTRLFNAVLDEAAVRAEVRGEDLTPEKLTRLADAFPGIFRKQFASEPPADVVAWEHVLRGFPQVGYPDQERSSLVLGAVLGEYLRHNHGATWRLSKGPLLSPAATTEPPAQQTPFGLEINPFNAARRIYGLPGTAPPGVGILFWFRDAVLRADGRTLVLANDPAEAKRALASLADPDLAGAGELFTQKQPEKAETMALEILKKKQHAGNHVLTLHVAKLLHDNRRLAAMRRILEGGGVIPSDPRHYNLMGLALLDEDPAGATTHFHTALRCDVTYGPAYLNMALAFEKRNDRIPAMYCLQRYLKVQPYGPEAADARHRLQVLETTGDGGGPGAGMGVPGGPVPGGGGAAPGR